MGTDITIYFERYNTITKAWVSTDEWGDVYGDWDVPHHHQIYTGRNYRLFALLAGERNYDNVTPIAEPRGIPDNCDERIETAITEYQADRSSYLTLAELLAFDWSAPMVVSGFVGLYDWYNWQDDLTRRKAVFPRSWCQGTNGEIISEEAARELVAKLKNERGGIGQMESSHWRTYVDCKWTRPTWLVCDAFWSSVIPHMFGLGKPEFVRMVFCFG